MTRLRRCARNGGAGVLALLMIGAAQAHDTPSAKLDFTPPEPGSYRLERIMPSPDGKVIDAHSKRRSLGAVTRGKVTLLSLMYTACSDEMGCPVAFYSIAAIRRDLERDPTVRGRVQVVSLSFDPEHDTPEAMRAYGGKHVDDGARVPWYFLTTESRRDLAPMLTGFDQDVSRPRNARSDRELVHVLKLFLIDRRGWVREIYSPSYLAPQVVLNDIRTLLLEDAGGRVD